jgi:TRAP-type C4-dicarboxylate transport system permease small subunit
MRLGHSAENILNRIVTAAGMGSTVLLGIMMMLTVFDVVLRYVFDRPIPGGMELTEYLMVCVGTLGLAWCALQGAHIKVELIVSKFPPRLQKVMDSFNYILLIAVSGLIASQTFVRAGTVRELGVASAMLDVPQYPFVLVSSFSYLLLFLTAIVLMIHAISSLISKAVRK